MRRLLLIPVFAAACLAGACASDHNYSSVSRESAPAISLDASNRDLAVGDTTTFTVNSRNTLGRDAHVEWTTTGGQLHTEDNGRIARASFSTPGAYTVTAVLIVDGRETARDDITVNVKPIR